jgi:hypothetical protein
MIWRVRAPGAVHPRPGMVAVTLGVSGFEGDSYRRLSSASHVCQTPERTQRAGSDCPRFAAQELDTWPETTEVDSWRRKASLHRLLGTHGSGVPRQACRFQVVDRGGPNRVQQVSPRPNWLIPAEMIRVPDTRQTP